MKHINTVFDWLPPYILFINSKKCAFFEKSIFYLGHIIQEDEISPDGKNTIAIKNWQKPTFIHELQNFLGFSNYYQQFISTFSNLVSSMYSLFKANGNKLT
jgi:hypothetical protein